MPRRRRRVIPKPKPVKKQRRRVRRVSMHIPFDWFSVLMAFLCGSYFLRLIFQVHPQVFLSSSVSYPYFPFWILLLLFVGFTLKIFLGKISKTILYTAGIITMVWLRFVGLGDSFNMILLFVIIILSDRVLICHKPIIPNFRKKDDVVKSGHEHE